jgi:hypothetical protein
LDELLVDLAALFLRGRCVDVVGRCQCLVLVVTLGRLAGVGCAGLESLIEDLEGSSDLGLEGRYFLVAVALQGLI